MRNIYRRICRDIRLSVSNMENHIHNFLNKIRPGLGLLRSFRGTLPQRIPRDIESAQPELIQSQNQDYTIGATENAVHPQNPTNLAANQDDQINSLAATPTSTGNNVENEEDPQRRFTKGPSRFTIASDGSNECVALLVSEGFLDKLRDLFQETRDVSALEGPLHRAEIDAQEIEKSITRAQESLETVEGEQAEEHRIFIEQQTSKLLKINRWKDELENERSLIEAKLELSRSHTQWVLETAMKEADYLGPEKPLPAILLRNEEIECAEEKAEAPEYDMPLQSPAESVASYREEVEVSEEELQRRAAYDEFIDRSQLLDTLQTNFDNQQYNYRENLARFEQEVEAGTNTMSRSAFDRRSVQYGQQLTRALIDAEEAFEEARDHALALNAITSTYGHDFYPGADYEESWPENKIANYNASQDWSSVQAWMDDIPAPAPNDDVSNSHHDRADDDDDGAVVELDEWDAGEVEVNDSISVIDWEEYRRDIDRYRRMCDRLVDPCPEVRWLGQPDEGAGLERRNSCWM